MEYLNLLLMKHGNHYMKLQNRQKLSTTSSCKLLLLLLLYIGLPNLFHVHFIFHYYGLLGEEQEYCGIEILYNVPHIVINFSIALYLVFKLGIREFLTKYSTYLFIFLLGGVLFFLLGQHPYMDYYSN